MRSCVVVGAGISGIIAARRLQKKGVAVKVIEKSKGFGGRMATRRVGEAVFDHGAQYLTVHGMFFRVVIEDLQDQGLVKEWGRGFLNGDKILNMDGYLRFFGSQGMASIAQKLAEPLEICLEENIVSLQAKDSEWILQSESGGSWQADAVILSPPLPQSLTLLNKSGIEPEEEILQRLKAVKFDPCIVVMAELEAPSTLPSPGALSQKDPMSPISWIADNQAKGISPVPALTIQATAHFSRSHWKEEKEAVGLKLWEAAQKYNSVNYVALDVHKWRFAQVQNPLQENYFELNHPLPLYLAGDAFGDPFNPVEGAAVSGLESAKALLKRWA